MGQPVPDALDAKTRSESRCGFREPIGATGFEPATPRSQSGCATKLRHAPVAASLLPSAKKVINRSPARGGNMSVAQW